MKVKNYMEDVVEILLPNVLQNYKDTCECEQCINDIKAIALNNLPPKYVATEKGEILSKANIFTVQSEIDVTRVLVEAIKKVNQSPRHREMK